MIKYMTFALLVGMMIGIMVGYNIHIATFDAKKIGNSTYIVEVVGVKSLNEALQITMSNLGYITDYDIIELKVTERGYIVKMIVEVAEYVTCIQT